MYLKSQAFQISFIFVAGDNSSESIDVVPCVSRLHFGTCAGRKVKTDPVRTTSEADFW